MRVVVVVSGTFQLSPHFVTVLVFSSQMIAVIALIGVIATNRIKLVNLVSSRLVSKLRGFSLHLMGLEATN